MGNVGRSEQRFNLRLTRWECAACGRLAVIEPPAVYVLESGLLVEGQAEDVRRLYSLLLDYAAGTGGTPWQAAYRLLLNTLTQPQP